MPAVARLAAAAGCDWISAVHLGSERANAAVVRARAQGGARTRSGARRKSRSPPSRGTGLWPGTAARHPPRRAWWRGRPDPVWQSAADFRRKPHGFLRLVATSALTILRNLRHVSSHACVRMSRADAMAFARARVCARAHSSGFATLWHLDRARHGGGDDQVELQRARKPAYVRAPRASHAAGRGTARAGATCSRRVHTLQQLARPRRRT